jgi:two-component system sensor kinase FixL
VAPGAVTVLADRIQVQQVMVNLVRNAVEAMKGQQRAQVLTISARVVDGMALVQVVDTGAGVTPEGEERLFAPFMSTKRDGMGVGLSICRRIIEAHGGRMWFEPAKGGGAEFNFTLPIIPIEASHDRL